MDDRINAILLGFYNNLATLSHRCPNTNAQSDEYYLWLIQSKLGPSILVIKFSKYYASKICVKCSTVSQCNGVRERARIRSEKILVLVQINTTQPFDQLLSDSYLYL